MRSRWCLVILAAAGCSGRPPGAEQKAPDRPAPSASAAPTTPVAPPDIDRVTPLPSPAPAVAARVNGEPVAFRNVAVLARKSLYPSGPVPVAEAPYAYRKALQDLIERELLFQEAMARKIALEDRAVEQAYNEARLPYKDDLVWADYLKKERLTPEAFRGELRIQLTVQSLIRQENSKIPPTTREEADAFYRGNPQSFEMGEVVHCRHILVRVKAGTPPGAKTALRANADAILKRLRAGEDFAKVARESSEDRTTASRGGDLGDMVRDQMPEAFALAAYALKPGQISGVVECPLGFEILKLEEKRAPVRLSFEQAEDQVKRFLDKKKRQDGVQALVASLRAKAKIETYL